MCLRLPSLVPSEECVPSTSVPLPNTLRHRGFRTTLATGGPVLLNTRGANLSLLPLGEWGAQLSTW